MTELTELKKRLHALASPEAAIKSARYFKTVPGEYAAGDRFIGVRVPAIRSLVPAAEDWPIKAIESLLHSPIHEERHLALLIFVRRMTRGDETEREEIYARYLANTKYINNWDLVDCSAPTIVGGHLVNRDRAALPTLAKSLWLWDRRIAIVATQHFIRLNDFTNTLAIAKRLMNDHEDLIHKAVGWMLREVGDRDEATLDQFLATHAAQMPRTMLRSALENVSPDRRKQFLAKR